MPVSRPEGALTPEFRARSKAKPDSTFAEYALGQPQFIISSSQWDRQLMATLQLALCSTLVELRAAYMPDAARAVFRSPPSLLTTAPCGLRPAPDYRLRGTFPHLSYSCAPPLLMTAPVTHGHCWESRTLLNPGVRWSQLNRLHPDR
jgi:hypothetical protein